MFTGDDDTCTDVDRSGMLSLTYVMTGVRGVGHRDWGVMTRVSTMASGVFWNVGDVWGLRRE